MAELTPAQQAVKAQWERERNAASAKQPTKKPNKTQTVEFTYPALFVLVGLIGWLGHFLHK